MSIDIQSLSYIHPDGDLLFSEISFTITKGEKVSLVGNNGSGKSTILKILANELQQSEGTVILSEKPYYIPQHMGQYDSYSIARAMRIDEKLNALYAIFDGNASSKNFEILNDDWEVEEKAKAALSFWGIGHLALFQSMKSLSGGEKTKVFLSGILIDSPQIILFDEPSNHLDSESRAVLYDFIQKSKSTILTVSHDKALLNLSDATFELSKNSIEIFAGNYDFYKDSKDHKLHTLEAQLEEKQKMIRQTRQKSIEITQQRQKQDTRGEKHSQKKMLPRIISGALSEKAERTSSKIKNTQNEKISILSKNLQDIKQQIQDQKVLKINLCKSDLHKGKILIDAKDINFSYEIESLWKSPLTFQIRSNDRIGITGKNGSGKTTLIKIITRDLLLHTGKITRADFRHLYIDQEYSIINNHLSVINQVELFNDRHLPEHELKILLHYHQFTREFWDRKCAGLSGGEKMKLILCCVAISNNTPDMIILDEPTNNLDIYSQEVLTEAIKSFNGTIILISHDKHFINEIDIRNRIEL